MTYYDYEFYNELSEFDEQIKEFKAALVSSIKEEFLDEMERLRKENESLREFRDKKEEYEREFIEIKTEYERKIKNIEREADKKKLKAFLVIFMLLNME